MRSPELRPVHVNLPFTFSAQGHLIILVNFSVALISTDLIPCIGIDLGEISETATFSCDPDLRLFCSRSLDNFGYLLCLSLLSFILMNSDIILCMFIDLDQIFSNATFLYDPDLDFLGHRNQRLQ